MLAWWGFPAIEFMKGFDFLCFVFESKKAGEESLVSMIMSKIKIEMNLSEPLIEENI